MNRDLEAVADRRGARTLTTALLALALSIGLLGCGPGVECDSCDNDQDCKSGLTCKEFSDGNTYCADNDPDNTCFK